MDVSKNVKTLLEFKSNFNVFMIIDFCQPQAKAKAKAMPGRLYIHTGIINNNQFCVLFEFSQKGLS